MLELTSPKIGYVLKVYPRYSETFILTEILAHERAGLDLAIFSLRPATDGLFHDALARIRARVTYLPGETLKAAELWQAIRNLDEEMPDFWHVVKGTPDVEVQDIYQAVLLARKVKAMGITHLHAHFGTVATTVARLASQMAGITYSFTAHAKDIYHESVKSDDLRRKIRDAAFVVTVSDYNLQYLRETFDEVTQNVARIYNGLDLQEFPYIAPSDRPMRLLAVGRLVEKKGFTHLIDAARILVDQGRLFQLDIIGGGEMEGTLRTLIERLHLEEYVNLLGSLPQSEVKRHIQGAAVMAVPCVVGEDGNRDGLPTVLLEAMALGTPCISTDVTGIPEILHDGETGLLVPQRDPQALAAACARLLDDCDLRVRLAANAREMIETQFDIHCNTGLMRQHFAAAIAQRA
jgi:colanic acid/amylovoran biosynthesis glycosyltransferase